MINEGEHRKISYNSETYFNVENILVVYLKFNNLLSFNVVCI